MIQPWLLFENAPKALAFYKLAFGAKEIYRLEPVDGELIARLSLEGAEFWVASGGEPCKDIHKCVRMVVTVSNPEGYMQQALEAGAQQVFPVQSHHGWRSGKVSDPFGHQWEFGYEID